MWGPSVSRTCVTGRAYSCCHAQVSLTPPREDQNAQNGKAANTRTDDEADTVGRHKDHYRHRNQGDDYPVYVEIATTLMAGILPKNNVSPRTYVRNVTKQSFQPTRQPNHQISNR